MSVVIPTLGTRTSLWSSVEGAVRAASATGPDAEVLVVVNGARRLPALPRSSLVRVLRLERANVARARNAGLAAACNDIVLFGDDGAGYPPSWGRDLAAALAGTDCPVVTAPVRVPQRGPVTAFCNHQRLFDAPPVDARSARTVTGNCGVRRDLLPGWLRFDEKLPLVGEDVAFGHAVRAAGLPIRWLAGTAPGLHLLPEHVDEITERARRYGRGAALVWRGDGTGADPAGMLAQFRLLASAGYRRYRRFPEVRSDGLRAAFALYGYLFEAAFVAGYLAEALDAGGAPVADVDLAGLTSAWRSVADRAAAAVVSPATAAVGLDLTRLDVGTTVDLPLVEAARQALADHVRPGTGPAAPVSAVLPAPAASAASVSGPVSGTAGQADLHRVLAVWRAVRADGGPTDLDTLDARLRTEGLVLREACAVIERAAMWRAGRATASAS
ncbi:MULTISPECIES: glycosyltransferase [unclassified Solwaraspora]|uniref:glycosyltransferase n=1 Tax=unclassified Solwaraspora TaxID=2627926 RepID=UPI00259AFC9B|nr:glycosyltransferase [Solwaraspora sp. WMMA2056]WJK38238.1 glycosyltransferase [Solwaraspora sp. WMMA2056]